MAAANLTAKSLYNLHAYFSILAMPPHLFCITPELLRDSTSFSTIQVTALQFGRQIYKAMLSYMQPEDGSYRPLRLNIPQQNNRQNSAINKIKKGASRAFLILVT